jgi:ATP-dependent Lon protease
MIPNTNQFIPVLPIRDTVIFPGTIVPVRIGRTRSVSALEAAQNAGGWAIAITQRENKDEKEAGGEDLFHIGTLVKIETARGSAKKGFHTILRGETRFRVQEIRDVAGYLEARGEAWPDRSDLDPQVEKALLTSARTMATEVLALVPADTSQLIKLVEGLEDLTYLSYLCAANLEATVLEKQEMLENASLKARVLKLLELMQHHKEALQIQSDIRDRLANKLGKAQREALLRQQMDAIREELGEGTSAQGEGYREKIEKAGMPPDALKIALEECKRLETIGNQSPESHVIRNYLDLLCALPWSKSAESVIELERAREVLETEHYGLDKIKKRIVQQLAVMKLKKNGHAPILLFVGPPGVGKTSLGQSIAKALGRKFVRASLGGVRDDAEIRGHRRTYIGAMPGRILQGIKRAEENNPVFMLDEIDKLGRGFQGDPGSALLEVLDPEQNSHFMDHYLDVAFDLSNTLFIATANSLDTIPGPLLDRMEVIELTGYTVAEKLHIAKRHLIPKQLEEHGLGLKQGQISDEALLRIISHYTREAGVRELQRHIGAVCRVMAERVATGADVSATVRIEKSELDAILGPERFTHEVAEQSLTPGVVTGLAWTPQGGDILFIETNLMPGSGKLILTGQLGDVMKESAQIAMSLVRSRMAGLFPSVTYAEKDLHLHVPSGAIPKDGPSAGTAILTAVASLFAGKKVSPKLAMTGEITLRGAVMPVGGVKEKVIAAHRSGIERILLPRRNERDLKDVPDEVKSSLRFEFVDTIDDVLNFALDMPRGAFLSPPELPPTTSPAAA